jgi:hypothetical protein
MRRLALVAVLAVAACSSSPPDTGPLQPPPMGQGIQYEMTGSLDPGQEIERCKLFTAPPEGLFINKETVRYTAGSHHVLLYATGYTTFPATNKHNVPVLPETVYDCPDGAPADFDITSVVAGAQSANAPNVIDLPSGVALKVAGGTILVMNTHYLNATPNKVDTDARVNLYTIPQSEMKTEAGIIFFYDPIIRVASMEPGQARMACPVNREYTVYNLQTHMHKRGLGGLANLTDHDGNVIQELYTSPSWENVPVKTYDSLKIEAGQYLDYRCNYQNDEDHTILQGLTTKDEMCMLIGAYSPVNAPFGYCSPDGSTGAKGFAATFIGNGAVGCMESVDCIEKVGISPDGAMVDPAYACVLNSCEKVARPFNAALRCEITQLDGGCKTACQNKSDPGCLSCLHSNCTAEMSACASAACN